MAKLIKHKWIIFVIILVMIVVLESLVTNVSIADRGIVVGIGIDREGNEIVISTQILLQKNGGVNEGGFNFVTVTDREKTVKGAMDKISDKLGMSVSVAHSVVLVFSKEFIASGGVEIIQDFLVNDEVSEVISLIMVDGSAKEMLELNIAHGETSSFQLERMLRAEKKPLGTNKMILKKFVVDYYAPNMACFMPIAHSQKTKPNTEQGKTDITETVELVINRSAVITKGGRITQLSDLANEGLSIATEEIRSGNITIESDKGEPVAVNVMKIKSNPSYNFNDKTVTYTVKIKCMREKARLDKDGIMSYLLSDGEKTRLEQAIDERLQKTYSVAKENNADVLGVYNGFYRKYGNEWVNFAQEDYLDKIKLQTKVVISQR